MVCGRFIRTECCRVSQNEKHAELFAKGKPIHPYSLQCKVFHIQKYSSTSLHFVYPASLLVKKTGLDWASCMSNFQQQ